MAMSWIWTGIVTLALVGGLFLGNGQAVATAAVNGAADGVELCLSMAGILCLWTGVRDVMRRAGLCEKLTGMLKPLLKRLYPDFAKDDLCMNAVAANVSANLLGLGNAATPMGIEAARRMSLRSPGVASDSLCMLVVCNTASVQLIPSTVAAVRAAAGCKTPFDILPAVWITSFCSAGLGLTMAWFLGKLWPHG